MFIVYRLSRPEVPTTMPKTTVKLSEIGEFGLIGRIRNWMASSSSGLIKGIGDDVAVIQMDGGILLATTDMHGVNR